MLPLGLGPRVPPLLAGVALLPQMAMAVIGSTVSGRITARTGPRLPMLIGLTPGGAGLLALMVIDAGSAYWVLVVPFIAAGLGVSLTVPAATTAVMEARPSGAGLAWPPGPSTLTAKSAGSSAWPRSARSSPTRPPSLPAFGSAWLSLAACSSWSPRSLRWGSIRLTAHGRSHKRRRSPSCSVDVIH